MADENNEVQLTPIEVKASEQGWVPQDQWEGDADAWRPAKEFLDRGELFKKIDDQRRDNKELRKVVEDLKQHNARIADIEYKRALATLKSKKRDALVEGDADAVIEIDEQIDAVKEAQREVVERPQPSVAQEVNPIFAAWVERNSWFNSNKAMRAFANDLGRDAAAQGMSPNEVLKFVETEVKKEFADKFRNPRRDAPGAVEGSTNKGSSKSGDDFELTDLQRQVMSRLVRQKVLTKEEYIAQLKKAESK